LIKQRVDEFFDILVQTKIDPLTISVFLFFLSFDKTGGQRTAKACPAETARQFFK
jgi:hypothetical protein